MTAKQLLLPLVQEAWSAYAGLTNVLGKLRQRILQDEKQEGQDVFQALMYQYFEQREALREFLEKAKKEPEVSKFHTVPVMKSIPPVVALGNILTPKYMFGVTSDSEMGPNVDCTEALNDTVVAQNDPSINDKKHDNSWANFMSGKSDDWSSLLDETSAQKMLSSKDGRDHLKNAVFAAFKEHEESEKQDGFKNGNGDNSDGEEDTAEDQDPFGINDATMSNGLASADAEVDFAIFDSAAQQAEPTNPFGDNADAWSPVTFGSHRDSNDNGKQHARINSDSDGFFDQFQSQSLIESFANFESNSNSNRNNDSDAFDTEMHSKGAFDSGDGRIALTPSEHRPLSNNTTRKIKVIQMSGEKANPFDMFDSSNPFKEYSDNEGAEDERPPSLSSRGSYRSNSSAEDAIRRSEIALARLIENVQLSGIEIPFSAIKPGRRVGAGAFAVVYEGKYRGQSVAVKHLQLANINEKVILDFHKVLTAPGGRYDKVLTAPEYSARNGCLY